MAMIIVLICNLGGMFGIVEIALIWISLILTVVSLIDYIVKNANVLKDGSK
jgi:CDP-diacylglycerol--glycerol-3-phosphate 3-phosphatidyltransferase